jgi:hypothetical protein
MVSFPSACIGNPSINWVLFFPRHYKIFVKKIGYFTVKKEFRGGEELNAFRENGKFLVNFVQP